MKRTIDRRAVLMTTGAGLSLLPVSGLRAEEAKPAETPSAPPPIEAYAKSPLVDEIALSPDGKRVAMVSQRGDEKVLIHFNIDELKPTSILIGPSKIRNLLWADNEHLILIDSQTVALNGFAGNKHEFSQGRLIDLTTTKVKTLFKDMDGFYNIVVGDLHRIKAPDGYRVTASNYRMTGGYPLCLFSFSMDKATPHLIYEAERETQGFVLTPDGRPLAYSDFSDERKVWELYYNTAPPGKMANFKVIYTAKEALDIPSLEGLGRDGQSVVVYISKGAAEGAYHEISASGALSEPLDAPKNSSSTPLFHPTTKLLAGFSYRDDWVNYEYTDPLLKKLDDSLPVIMGDEYRCAIIEYAEDPRKMLVYGESPTDAGSYYFVDFSNGNMVSIASNYDLPEEWITQKKPIVYKAADGLEIHAYLTLPPKRPPKNLPLIVLPHGGPQVRDYIDFDWLVQALAARGYAVLQPNYRGSAGYGDEFIDAGHGQFGRKMQTDLSDGVRELAKQGLIDLKRVAIFGASYGGYAAVAGATLDPGIYNCAVAIAGVTDPKTFIDFVDSNSATIGDSSGVLYWRQFMGDPKTYDEISPVKQAGKASCPILLMHGTDDTVVPISQSQRMEKALKAAGKPVEFITYKGQTHWEDIGSSRIEMMKAAMAFLTKYNPA